MRPRSHALIVAGVVLAMLVPVVLVPPAAVAVPEGPEHPSPEWTAREAANYARTLEGPARHTNDPTFEARLAERSISNLASYAERQVAEPYWISEGNVCATWGEECVGDPFRYPGVDPFYDLAVDFFRSTPDAPYPGRGTGRRGRAQPVLGPDRR